MSNPWLDDMRCLDLLRERQASPRQLLYLEQLLRLLQPADMFSRHPLGQPTYSAAAMVADLSVRAHINTGQPEVPSLARLLRSTREVIEAQGHLGDFSSSTWSQWMPASNCKFSDLREVGIPPLHASLLDAQRKVCHSLEVLSRADVVRGAQESAVLLRVKGQSATGFLRLLRQNLEERTSAVDAILHSLVGEPTRFRVLMGITDAPRPADLQSFLLTNGCPSYSSPGDLPPLWRDKWTTVDRYLPLANTEQDPVARRSLACAWVDMSVSAFDPLHAAHEARATLEAALDVLMMQDPRIRPGIHPAALAIRPHLASEPSKIGVDEIRRGRLQVTFPEARASLSPAIKMAAHARRQSDPAVSTVLSCAALESLTGVPVDGRVGKALALMQLREIELFAFRAMVSEIPTGPARARRLFERAEGLAKKLDELRRASRLPTSPDLTRKIKSCESELDNVLSQASEMESRATRGRQAILNSGYVARYEDEDYSLKHSTHLVNPQKFERDMPHLLDGSSCRTDLSDLNDEIGQLSEFARWELARCRHLANPERGGRAESIRGKLSETGEWISFIQASLYMSRNMNVHAGASLGDLSTLLSEAGIAMTDATLSIVALWLDTSGHETWTATDILRLLADRYDHLIQSGNMKGPLALAVGFWSDDDQAGNIRSEKELRR